jgi:hypothetical protein
MLIRAPRAAAHISIGRRTSGLILVGATLLIVGILAGVRFATADPPDTQARLTTLAAARQVLGRDVPQVRLANLGLQLTSVAVDPVSSPNRGVHQTYALAAQNVVTLSSYNADSIDRVGAGDFERIDLNGESATVSVKTFDGWQGLTYTWSHNGVANVLHVKLTGTLTRSVADQIAASVS